VRSLFSLPAPFAAVGASEPVQEDRICANARAALVSLGQRSNDLVRSVLIFAAYVTYGIFAHIWGHRSPAYVHLSVRDTFSLQENVSFCSSFPVGTITWKLAQNDKNSELVNLAALTSFPARVNNKISWMENLGSFLKFYTLFVQGKQAKTEKISMQ